MRTYILFNRINKIPKWRDVLTYIFDESFRKRPYCGFGRSIKNGLIRYDNYHWGKWEDNPDIPMYAHGTTLWVLFAPIKEGVSKLVLAKKKHYGFKHLAQLRFEKINPALIDLRAFHRLVYKYTSSVGGQIIDSNNKRLIDSTEYYQLHKSIIERPFNIHPTKSDLKRL